VGVPVFVRPLIRSLGVAPRVRSGAEVLALGPRRIRRVNGRRQLEPRNQITPGGVVAAAIPIRVARHTAPRVVP
jgi:hypothetical protein